MPKIRPDQAKHTCELKQRAFNKRHPGCPRCEELKAGAPSINALKHPDNYFLWQQQQDNMARRAIEEHRKNIAATTCSPRGEHDWTL